jgi:hypothetical protein
VTDEHQAGEEATVREFDREERRLVRLRSVIELDVKRTEELDDFDPGPQEAA